MVSVAIVLFGGGMLTTIGDQNNENNYDELRIFCRAG
jgi:hypothetical protein